MSASPAATSPGMSATSAPREHATVRRALVVVLSVVFLGLLPLWPLGVMFGNVIVGGAHVTDFRNTFYPAAEAVLHGHSPYPDAGDEALALGRAYVYPPLTAVAAVPFTAMPLAVAQVAVLLLLTATIFLTLGLLGVRDWRCYGMVVLWPPFLAAVKTGNITALLCLAAALAWRFRDRASYGGASVGVSLAAKLFLWPLVVWQAATRRWRAVGVSLGVAAAVVLASWAVIGFAGFTDYPHLLRRLQDLEAPQSYTLYALGLDLGAPSWLARGLWVAVGIALVVGSVWLARDGDDRRSFVLALAAALALSPIVWLNYFVLLMVIVAVAEPRLGPAWFVPLVMYGSASTYNGTTLQNALTIAAAALTVTLALRPSVRAPADDVEPVRTAIAAGS